MNTLIVVLVVVAVLVLLALALAVRIVKQYEQGVLFRLGRVQRRAGAGAAADHPVRRRAAPGVAADRHDADPVAGHHHPRQRQRRRVRGRLLPGRRRGEVGASRSRTSRAAIDQIAQTTLRKVVGQHTLDETLSETDRINLDIREILDVTTVEWGVEVTLVELKDIQLPDSMKRAMARQAEAEREKRAKIINAEGESLAAAALGDASDTMMAHPLALQLRNLQSLVEIGVDKNTTVVFPAPLMSTIEELGAFLTRENNAARSGKAPGISQPNKVAAPQALR